MSLIFIITGTIIALAIGVWMLVGGLRGRRLDDHAVCRRCRFDLSGSIPGTPRCPECGASLGAPRAIAIGNRRWSPVLAGAGALVLLTTILGGGTLIALNQGVSDLVKYAPSRVLAWVQQLTSVGSKSSTVALSELAERLGRGELPADIVLNVARIGLSVQADASTIWNPKWGDFIESARSDLNDQEWRTYLRNMLGPVTVEVPVTTGEGEQVKVVVYIDHGRTASYSSMAIDATVQSVRVGPVVAVGTSKSLRMSVIQAPFVFRYTFRNPALPGGWTVTAPVHIKFRDFNNQPGIADVEMDVLVKSGTMQVKPSTKATTKLINAPQLAPSSGAWGVKNARLVQNDSEIDPPNRLEYSLVAREPTKVAMSFEVWLIYPERPTDAQSPLLRVKLDSFGFSEGYRSETSTAGELPGDFPLDYYRTYPGIVDFEIVPRRFEDRGSHAPPIWGETILIPGVPVRMKIADDAEDVK